MVGCYTEDILEDVTDFSGELRESVRVLAAEYTDIDHRNRFGVASSEIELVFRLEAYHEPAFGFAGDQLDCFSEAGR